MLGVHAFFAVAGAQVLMVQSALDASCEPLKGSPLYNAIQRLLGARVGEGVCWLSNLCPEPEMLSIGAWALIAPGVDFFTHNFENMRFTYEPVAVGAGCVVGERASLMGHSTLGDGAQLMPMAQGMKGTALAPGRRYTGNPADALWPSEAWWAVPGMPDDPLGLERPGLKAWLESSGVAWQLRRVMTMCMPGRGRTAAKVSPLLGDEPENGQNTGAASIAGPSEGTRSVEPEAEMGDGAHGEPLRALWARIVRVGVWQRLYQPLQGGA